MLKLTLFAQIAISTENVKKHPGAIAQSSFDGPTISKNNKNARAANGGTHICFSGKYLSPTDQ